MGAGTMINAITGSGYLEYLDIIRQQVGEGMAVGAKGATDAAGISGLIRESTAAMASAGAGTLIANRDLLLGMLEAGAVLASLARQMKLEDLKKDIISVMPPPSDRVFATADTDKDGHVSRDELAAVIGGDGADKLFGIIDTDGDELISRGEDAAFREERQAAFLRLIPEGTELAAAVKQNNNLLIKIFTETMKTQSSASLLSAGSLSAFFA
jgi:hypothetical protein